MDADFRVFFRKKSQYFDVYLWDVHPTTFSNWKAGRWGYFVATWEHPKREKFGEIHLVHSKSRTIRIDTVSHELDHLRQEWLWANRVAVGGRNEEWFCRFGDELTRKFWREYDKYTKRNQR